MSLSRRFRSGVAMALAVTLCVTTDRHSRADEEIVRPASADCTYDTGKFREPREVWRRMSENAEMVAPSNLRTSTNASGSRRRVTAPLPSFNYNFTARNFIDTEIFGKMKRDAVPWTGRSSDEEFLRRVSLDLTGMLPTADAVKAFVADTDADKRDKMIETLLASDAFNDRWTMWFGDLVQNVQVAANTVEYPQGRNAYHKFIRDSFVAKKPYDEFVRELLAGTGRSFTQGETNYWVRQIQGNGPIQDTYDNLSSASAERFLAIPLNCLSCHSGFAHLELVNTGLAKKTRMEFWQNAAFFSQVTVVNERDATNNIIERVLSDNTTGSYRLNTTSGNKSARQPAPGQPAFVDPAFILTGEKPQAGETRRKAYGRMLTAHPQFARATVNYLWKELFGLGIVEPVEAFDLARLDPAALAAGATLQPTHPQLLNLLADAFVASGYDFRGMLRTMVQSNAYQLSSRYTPGVWMDVWAPYFARHLPKRMMGEMILDAIFQATNVGASLPVTSAPAVTRAMQLPDPTEGRTFQQLLNNFGRGDRDEQARTNDGSVIQALMLLNDRAVTDRIRATANNSTVQRLTRASSDPAVIAEGLYLATLSRYPTADERAAAVAYLRSGDLVRKTEDLQYVLINKLEFLFN